MWDQNLKGMWNLDVEKDDSGRTVCGAVVDPAFRLWWAFDVSEIDNGLPPTARGKEDTSAACMRKCEDFILSRRSGHRAMQIRAQLERE